MGLPDPEGKQILTNRTGQYGNWEGIENQMVTDVQVPCDIGNKASGRSTYSCQITTGQEGALSVSYTITEKESPSDFVGNI